MGWLRPQRLRGFTPDPTSLPRISPTNLLSLSHPAIMNILGIPTLPSYLFTPSHFCPCVYSVKSRQLRKHSQKSARRAWALFVSRLERLRVRLNCSKDQLLVSMTATLEKRLSRPGRPRCDERGTLREIALGRPAPRRKNMPDLRKTKYCRAASCSLMPRAHARASPSERSNK